MKRVFVLITRHNDGTGHKAIRVYADTRVNEAIADMEMLKEEQPGKIYELFETPLSE